jgi:Kef-type K+ transport system membrane component KefB
VGSFQAQAQESNMDEINPTNLIAVAVAMVIAAGIPALLPRLPLPGVVLEIALGAVIGPQVLGLVHPGVRLNFMADFLGLGMLFLMAGFETDPAVLRGRPIPNALFGWAITAVIAFGAAMLLNILYQAALRQTHAGDSRIDRFLIRRGERKEVRHGGCDWIAGRL